MIEVIEARQQLLVVIYKNVLFSTNELNLSLPSIVVSLLQTFQDLFPEKVPQELLPLRGISTKSTLFLVQVYKIGQHTVQTLRRPMRFNIK